MKDGETVDYAGMVESLAVSGAPAIVLVLYPEEVSNLLNAAKSHPVLGTDAVIWISVDSWSDLALDNGTVVPNGVIGLTSYQANNSHTIKYRELWQSLDPTEYKDTDGDRSTFAAYSLHIVDAVAALAMAYQRAFDDDTGVCVLVLWACASVTLGCSCVCARSHGLAATAVRVHHADKRNHL